MNEIEECQLREFILADTFYSTPFRLFYMVGKLGELKDWMLYLNKRQYKKAKNMFFMDHKTYYRFKYIRHSFGDREG